MASCWHSKTNRLMLETQGTSQCQFISLSEMLRTRDRFLTRVMFARIKKKGSGEAFDDVAHMNAEIDEILMTKKSKRAL